MPRPTIRDTKGGLRPCCTATIAPPICGPIAASNSVTRVVSSGVDQRKRGRRKRQLEATASRQCGPKSASLIEPELQPDRDQRQRRERVTETLQYVAKPAGKLKRHKSKSDGQSDQRRDADNPLDDLTVAVEVSSKRGYEG
ncbi:hypothetical protein AAFG07_11325 [Bradyrhizobium sp. B097]|uniref:hypothetical protein n=1 Tax=Bradyrhizobium sp. B097 TaxID=3140244 RepID=UPI00318364BA